MAVTQEVQREMVEYLLAAYREWREVEKLTARCPDLPIATAYELQQQLIARMEADGERCIGLTSRAKQQVMGVHEAIYGYLTDGMLALEWEPLSYRRFIHPKAEPEIAFLLGDDLAGTAVTKTSASPSRTSWRTIAPLRLFSSAANG